MGIILDRFPVFEANQVLTSGHLNDVFDYLDQQTRQTRTHLIGIGIVCGLEVRLDGAAIKLAKGCGVSSEGYLLIEPKDISLVSYRNYVVPTDVAYPMFDGVTLWELFPAGEPATTPITSPSNFLDDKAVLLFLELKKQGLRNCSPNNCDDKGAEVTANVRRLLIRIADLDTIIAAANALGTGLTSSDIDAALSAKLNLPDLHTRRFDVLNSYPVTSNDVYAGFLNTFRVIKLATATATALNACYNAFQPVLKPLYPTNPFTAFGAAYGFLDSAPATTAQVRFLQYYADLFDDIVCAYDEFRWKGLDLLYACCPPDGLFPRHLMLGPVHPEKVTQPLHYRQRFLPSPAVGDCQRETGALLLLFARLVEMTLRFTNAPALPKPNASEPIDPQIRVTPSTLGDRALATKAIPYYYTENGTPPLYQRWDVDKTRRGRANQNLGYRSDAYTPIAPAFVTDPLRYDIEPYNFLRVEGHLGKDFHGVLTSLTNIKSQYRLPIDVIALRTGAYDDTQAIDLTKESARFQDLEALYDSLREELLSSLAEGARELYDTLIKGLVLPAGTPKFTLLKTYAPNYKYPANSVGAWFEKYLTAMVARPYIDVDQTKIDPNEVAVVYCQLFSGTTGMASENSPHAVSLFYILKLAAILPSSLDALGYADFENKYQDLLGLVRYFRSGAIDSITADLKTFIPQGELLDLCDEILFDCKLTPIKAVHDEYIRRIGELKKMQFLSNFLARHPGIQHKAGVPLGGTFILVYHDDPAPTPGGAADILIGSAAMMSQELVAMDGMMAVENGVPAAHAAAPAHAPAPAPARSNARTRQFSEALGRIASNRALADNEDIKFVMGSLNGNIPVFGNDSPINPNDAASQIIASAVGELTDGAVIADFFLPYQLSSLPGIQFVLPKSTPIFSANPGCANVDGNASVAIDAKGGLPPYDIAVDKGPYAALNGPLTLHSGDHSLMLRDADGTETPEQIVTVMPPLTVGDVAYKCTDQKFTVSFKIAGGTAPYSVAGNKIAGDSFTTQPAPSGANIAYKVEDSDGCSIDAKFTHSCPPPCTLPCAGLSVKRNYRFWIPDGDPTNLYKSFKLGDQPTDLIFQVETAPGQMVDLAPKVRAILVATPAQLAQAEFPKTAKVWIDKINALVMADLKLHQGTTPWLTLGYQASGAGRLGVLTIDHFECLKFDIRIGATIVRNNQNEPIVAHYLPEGTAIQAGDKTVQIPAYEGTKQDKCNPGTPVAKFCPAPPAFSLKIAPSGTGRILTFKVAATPPTPDLVYVWEAEGAIPAMGNGTSFATQFTGFDSVTRTVFVTAINKTGCTVPASIQVPLLSIKP